MEMHFFLLSPCAVVATTVPFLRKKGIFLNLRMVSASFIITYNFPNTEKRASRQGSRQFLPCRNNLLQPPLRSVASLGRLWLGRGLVWACKVMCSWNTPAKWQNTKPNAEYGQGTQSGSVWYLQAVPVLSLCRGVGVKIVCPLMGSWDSGLWTLGHWFGQNMAYFAVVTQRYLKRKDARDEGVIYAQRSMIHLNLSNDGVEFF